MIGDAMYEVPGSRLREMSDRITDLTARAERSEAAEADLRRQLADAKSAFFAAIDQRDGLRALLRDVGNHLSTEHEVRHLHDHLGENLGCAGCALLENVRAALFGPTNTEGAERHGRDTVR